MQDDRISIELRLPGVKVLEVKEEEHWIEVFDRLLHHAVIVVTEGESFRMKEARSRSGLRATSDGKELSPTPLSA